MRLQATDRRLQAGKAGLLCLSVLLSVSCFSGCAGSGRSVASSPRQKAVVHQRQAYVLGKVPDQAREQAFQDLLAAAQAAAVEKHGAAGEIGFSYSLSPKGAVYPFSEVEVACLMKKADASEGKELCSEFFSAVGAGLKDILKDK